MPVRLRNLTPHTVTIELASGERHDLPAEAPTPRCELVRTRIGTLTTQIGEVAVVATRLLPYVTDLPEPEAGIYLVVARMVGEACPDRADLLFPDELVREPGTGRVIGCRALGRIAVAVFEP